MIGDSLSLLFPCNGVSVRLARCFVSCQTKEIPMKVRKVKRTLCVIRRRVYRIGKSKFRQLRVR